jgi:hypothetical protein
MHRRAPALEAAHAAAAENGVAPMATEEAAAAEAEAAPADDGSWAEDAGGGEDVAAKFKPGIKFKLAA